MAILCRSNFLSRGFEEALMRARIPHGPVGDVGFYHRAEIKDALVFLRIVLATEDRQSDEAVRRVVNIQADGFGAKVVKTREGEAARR
jgi:DNA helicase-2/ATP-dependent DNA helicase PcrA